MLLSLKYSTSSRELHLTSYLSGFSIPFCVPLSLTTYTSPIDPNRVLLTGENPYMRLSETDGGSVTTDASFWRILFSPGGPGHLLFLHGELTDDEPRVYTDNIQMARWLQQEIQGKINATFGNLEITAREARFQSSGYLRSFWTESLTSRDEEISLTWYDLGEPFLSHTFPSGITVPVLTEKSVQQS